VITKGLFFESKRVANGSAKLSIEFSRENTREERGKRGKERTSLSLQKKVIFFFLQAAPAF